MIGGHPLLKAIVIRLSLLTFLLAATQFQAHVFASQGTKSKPQVAVNFPQSFPADTGRLPKGYRGVDAKRFFALFKAKSATLLRGEYEKMEAYEARIGDLDKVLAPISTSVLYAFRAEEFEFRYDADGEEYSARRDAACQDRNAYEGPFGQLTCRLSELTSTQRTYNASNAYGAQVSVDSFEGTYFGVTLNLGSPIVDGYVPTREVPNGTWVGIHDRFKVSLEKAKRLGEKGIGVLFVGRVMGTQLVTGPLHHSRPTRDFPYENKRQTFALPFEVVELVYYVPSTGEVLYRKKAAL